MEADVSERTLFAGQVALVTGGGSGVGRAIALALAARGATLCLVGRRLETLQGVARELEHGSQVHCLSADLTVDDDLRRLQHAIEQQICRIDLLIHSAGMLTSGRIEHAELADFDRHYRVNVRAPYALTQALLPLLIQRQGQVVFINSSAGLAAQAAAGQYAASKHALKAVADSLRAEVNASGVRVLSVFLGRTATPMQAALHAQEAKLYNPGELIQPEDVASTVVHALSLSRTAEITEISIRPMVKPA
jgi:NADP-dependent 3-hydroxy acid dehydrogenase YdfG